MFLATTCSASGKTFTAFQIISKNIAIANNSVTPIMQQDTNLAFGKYLKNLSEQPGKLPRVIVYVFPGMAAGMCI